MAALVTTWCIGILFGRSVCNNLGKYNCVFNINDPYVKNVTGRMFMERCFCWTIPGLTGIFSPRLGSGTLNY